MEEKRIEKKIRKNYRQQSSKSRGMKKNEKIKKVERNEKLELRKNKKKKKTQ